MVSLSGIIPPFKQLDATAQTKDVMWPFEFALNRFPPPSFLLATAGLTNTSKT
jgi:hypothetical protein